MPSSYTQNLGIEQPATGEQANVWGITVNRNFATYDLAIAGNTQIALSSSSYQLTINDGADLPLGANALIIWTGQLAAQGSVVMDANPGTRQHLHIMQNRTLGGFQIAFSQGSGGTFTLWNGYDAIIYSDGVGAGANVAAALANPQFANMLLTGNLIMQGYLTVPSIQGDVTLYGTLGVNVNLFVEHYVGIGTLNIPDPLTITGLGWGQLRLVYNPPNTYGTIFRNDGAAFYLMATNANDPYGQWAGWGLMMDLASREIGIGWSPTAGYALSVSNIHAGNVAVDGQITTGAQIVVQGGGINVTGRGIFSDPGDPYQIEINYPGTPVLYVGNSRAG